MKSNTFVSNDENICYTITINYDDNDKQASCIFYGYCEASIQDILNHFQLSYPHIDINKKDLKIQWSILKENINEKENITGYDNIYSSNFTNVMTLEYLNYYYEGLYTQNNKLILLFE